MTAGQPHRALPSQAERRAPRRQLIALACVLAAGSATGAALVAVLSSEPASKPTPVHPVAIVRAPAAPAAATSPQFQWNDLERGGDDG